MGILNFFKKNNSQSNQHSNQLENNEYLIKTFQSMLSEKGIKSQRIGDYFCLNVEDILEITLIIIDSVNLNPDLLHVMIIATNKDFFPNGIKENISGIGSNLEQKVFSALNNFINTTLITILESFKKVDHENHSGVDVILGNIYSQGDGNLGKTEIQEIYNVLKPGLNNMLDNSIPYYWIKVFISKIQDGEIIGECLVNNRPWDEGYELLKKYAESWNFEGAFLSKKQFIIIKKI